ncbi:MAG: tetratricopeptide repeat protein [Eubacteriales bacterium]|nr:tetratricopeptide repeat protein [Eubacteriales bacterium]
MKKTNDPKRAENGGRKHPPVRMLLGIALCALLSGCGRQMNKYELRDLGIEAMRAGDYEGAKQRFAEALEASNGQVSELQYDIVKYRAECEVRLNQFEDARHSYEVLSELDKNADNQWHYQEILAEITGIDRLSEAAELMEAGSYQEAYDSLELLSDLNGGMVGRTAYFNRAVCLEYLGRFSEAEDAFDAYLNQYADDEAAQKELDFLKTR